MFFIFYNDKNFLVSGGVAMIYSPLNECDVPVIR